MAKRRPNRPPAVPDWHLWSEVARSISPLKAKAARNGAGRVIPPRADRPAMPEPGKKAGAEPAREGGALFRNAGKAPDHPDAVWQPRRPGFERTGGPASPPGGLEPRIHRRVRRGQVPIDASIDLHGMRQDEARAALYRFVPARAERGDRTLLVITGKGLKKAGYGAIAERGVLRHMLAVWLNEPGLREHVAGWEVAARHHGGEGAFYVRLKRAAK